jgi:hypothetical protein
VKCLGDKLPERWWRDKDAIQQETRGEGSPEWHLPPDLLRALRDPTIRLPQDDAIMADGRSLWDHLAEWRNAPCNTASASPDGDLQTRLAAAEREKKLMRVERDTYANAARKLREAVRDGLTVFADTEWARTYRHLWQPDFVTALPAPGEADERASAEDVEPRADVAEGLPPTGGAGGSAQSGHAPKYQGVTVRDANGHAWGCPNYNQATFTNCTCDLWDGRYDAS